MSRLRNIPGAEETLARSPYVIQDPTAYRGSWRTSVFHNDHPLQLEIGMGKGRFLATQALANPQINYVGMELYASVLIKALRKLDRMSADDAAGAAQRGASSGGDAAQGTARRGAAAAQNAMQGAADGAAQRTTQGAAARQQAAAADEAPLPNLRLLCRDARAIPDIFGPGEVEVIYLNFSDPWPKARHANRRLTAAPFLARYAQVLSADGRIEFKTDNRELFDWSLKQAETSPGWETEKVTYDLHQDPEMNAGNVLTEYEEKYADHPICKLILKRRNASA